MTWVPRYTEDELAPHKVQPLPDDVLIKETQRMDFSAVGRKGVSDNAERKWIRWYEAVAERWRSGGNAA